MCEKKKYTWTLIQDHLLQTDYFNIALPLFISYGGSINNLVQTNFKWLTHKIRNSSYKRDYHYKKIMK